MAFDTGAIEKQFEEHMKAQPFECMCSACDALLTVRTEVDSDYDLTVYVDPCDCTKEEAGE